MSKRLFVQTVSSDETWFYCGGPSPEDAVNGLKNIIAHDVTEVLKGELSIECFREAFAIEVRELTDEEVAALPDC